MTRGGRIILNISAKGDKPYSTVNRRIGKINCGLYCGNARCHQFFAVGVLEPEKERHADLIDFKSDGVPLFECPFCHHRQRRQVSEIACLVLTEATKRKPPIARDAH